MKTKRQGYCRSGVGITLALCLLAGCSIRPLRTVMVGSGNLQSRRDIPLIRDNAGLYENIRAGNWNYAGQITGDIKHTGVCRVKYHPSFKRNHWMAVEGTMDNGRKYPVVLDTGASAGLFVNDIHILRNKLAVHPLSPGKVNGPQWGICHLPKLTIGGIILTNWPCFYREQHLELQIFGLPIDRDNAVIAGVPALRRFSYITFDGVNKEVEFSLEKAFECDKPHLWEQHPFLIEQDLGGNARLLVKIPIAGCETSLLLDTGSGSGLALSEDMWNRISHRVQPGKMTMADDLYPYLGRLPCKRAVVRQLSLGNRLFEQTRISIFPNDSPLLGRCDALLGMQYFRESVVVLDFERSVIWIKNASRN